MFLNGDKRHHVATLQSPCRDKVAIGTAGRSDISLVALFSIDAHRDHWQMTFGNDGCKGCPLLTVNRGELIEMSQRLPRLHQRHCVLTKVLQVYLLELVHTLEGIVAVFERMVPDILQLAVALVDSLDKNPML